MLSPTDLKGLYAIIATPAKPGADRLDATDTVDLQETARLVERLIQDGVSGLITLGTTGECATLSEADYRSFVGCVAETTRRRIPTFVGATTLGGHETVRRLRLLRQLRVDGTLLGLPMWQPLSTAGVVDFYAGISELFPDLAVMVYANTRAFRFDFSVDFWAEVAKRAPSVMASKSSRSTGLREMLAATRGRIHFMPSDMVVHEFHQASPETTTACWATAAGMNPLPSVQLMRALADGKRQEAEEWQAAIAWANAPIMPIVQAPEIFALYNIQVEKTRINAAGYSACGPSRPPYQHLPQAYEEASRECGLRWRAICAAWTPGQGFTDHPWHVTEPKETRA